MATFILSYPDRAFVPRGGEPKAGSASAAFTQWLALCDEIHRAQGRILVLDPTMAGEVSSVYSGLLGAPFLAPGKLPQPLFLRAHFGEVAQEDAVHKAIAEAGLVVQAAQHRWQGQVDVGWTCALGEDVQLDLGCNFGVTEAAPDFNPFVGLSRRF